MSIWKAFSLLLTLLRNLTLEKLGIVALDAVTQSMIVEGQLEGLLLLATHFTT